MKGRRVATVLVAVVGVWVTSLFFRAHGHMGTRLAGTAPANALSDTSTLRPQALQQPQVTELTAVDSAPPRLFVSNKEMQVPTGLRLMVFSPHPDDESLGASGLIQRVLEKEGKVQVVFMTNGDGYPEGVRRELGRLQTSTDDFIEYGEQRHDEAIHALKALGLEANGCVFLGFPDGGIDDLWADNWSRGDPYTSPFTRFDRPLYKDSLSRKLQYAGTNLVEEISRTLIDFAPDWVVLPDPRDRHPDHSATGLFVLDALRKLKEDKEEGFEYTQVFTYLIHFPDYPSSTGWTKRVKTAGVGGYGPPAIELSSTQWLNLPMTQEELEGKMQALGEHKSQILMLGDFFKLFLHPYEIFGKLETEQIMRVPREYAAQSRPNS